MTGCKYSLDTDLDMIYSIWVSHRKSAEIWKPRSLKTETLSKDWFWIVKSGQSLLEALPRNILLVLNFHRTNSATDPKNAKYQILRN